MRREGMSRVTTTEELGRGLDAIRFRPLPPRGLRFIDGVLYWEQPERTKGVTHYRIYADTETNLVREVPVGQTQMADNLTAARVFISAYSQPFGKESSKAVLETAVSPSGGGGGWTSYTLSGSSGTATTINGPGAPASDGLFHVITIIQRSAGDGTISWGSDFDASMPTSIDAVAGSVNTYPIYSRGGKWFSHVPPFSY